MLKYKEFYLSNSKTVKFHHNKQENLEKILLSQYIHLYIHDSAQRAKAKITTCKQQIFVSFLHRSHTTYSRLCKEGVEHNS